MPPSACTVTVPVPEVLSILTSTAYDHGKSMKIPMFTAKNARKPADLRLAAQKIRGNPPQNGRPSRWKRVSDFSTKRITGAGSAPLTRSGTTKGNIMFLSKIDT